MRASAGEQRCAQLVETRQRVHGVGHDGRHRRARVRRRHGRATRERTQHGEALAREERAAEAARRHRRHVSNFQKNFNQIERGVAAGDGADTADMVQQDIISLSLKRGNKLGEKLGGGKLGEIFGSRQTKTPP